MNPVTIIFVTYNSAHLLADMFASVQQSQVIVVDNASSDSTVPTIRADYPEVQLIENHVNIGYGRAANQAFAVAQTPYVMLVNPDVKITQDDVGRLAEQAHQLAEDWLFLAPDTGREPKFKSATAASMAELRWASGAALFIDLRQFWRIGGFDEKIFLFFEETDLCRKAEVAGIKMYYAPEVRCPHGLGKSSLQNEATHRIMQWHYQWSFLYFSRKHRQWLALWADILKIRLFYPLKLRFLRLEPAKRILYLVRYDACKAFCKGRGAFRPDGHPQLPVQGALSPLTERG